MKHTQYSLILLLLLAFNPFASNRLKNIRKEFLSSTSKNIMVAAHRGAHNQVPENSLASFQKAIDLGIDIIELDIRHTKDGIPVLMHDRTVDRTTNGKGKVEDLSFAEIQQLKLKHNGILTEEKVPTLEEALELTAHKIMIDLDIKTHQIKPIIAAVKKHKSEKKVIFFVYEPAHVNLIRKEDASFMAMVRTENEAQIDSVFMVTKAQAIHIDPSHNTATAVQKIKAKGARVWINALGTTDKKIANGDYSELETLLAHGANMIQTDQPELLLEYLQRKKLHP